MWRTVVIKKISHLWLVLGTLLFVTILIGCQSEPADPQDPQKGSSVVQFGPGEGGTTTPPAEDPQQEIAAVPGPEVQEIGLEPLVEAYSFSLADLNTEIPADVLAEVAFGGGGGGGYLCGDSFGDNSYSITFAAGLEDALDACYWRADEVVEVRVVNPEGEIITRELITTFEDGSELNRGWVAEYLFQYNPLLGPYGVYSVIFDSGERTAEVEVEITRPDHPVQYPLDDSSMIFFNFEPNEPLTVHLYELEEDEPCSWGDYWQGSMDYQASEDGFLVIETPFPIGGPFSGSTRLVGVGGWSGEAQFPHWGPMVTNLSIQEARAQEKQACLANMAEDQLRRERTEELVGSIGDFLAFAVEAEIRSYLEGDAAYAAAAYAGEPLARIRANIDELNEYEVIESPAIDYALSRYLDVRIIYTGRVEVDTCEVWTIDYFDFSGNYLTGDPPVLVPQKITVSLIEGGWYITAVEFFDPPAFCTGYDPALFGP